MIPFPVKAICPECGGRHIDRDEWATTRTHHKHLCEHCGHVWDFASFDTIGVEWDPRLDAREMWNLRNFEGLTPEDAVDLAQPRHVRALILGEAPGTRTSADMPMFPWPLTSAGGRLFQVSGFEIKTYLKTFDRANLLDTTGWNAKRAAQNAREIVKAWQKRRIVLCGNRVSDAFGYRGPAFTWVDLFGVRCVRIPHPSGRNPIYNDTSVGLRTRKTLREAAEVDPES